jgi:chemotaxis protein methyltransferase CheR
MTPGPVLMKSARKIAIPEEVRARLKSFITGRSGLYFKDHDMRDLEDVIADRTRACGFDSAVSYYSYLTTSEKKEDELRELLNRLTINHTYFFRNEPQFDALKKNVLPDILGRKAAEAPAGEKPKLRIWSAGCSTGEEAYSIAITVKELVLDVSAWDIQIIASDASTDALDKARRGVYSKNSVRSVDSEYLERYFARRSRHDGAEDYAVSDDIKNMVSFVFHNLIVDEYPADFDVIFCRNVVIYFDMDTTMRVMTRLHSSLADGGYIFIGYSESLYYMPEKFRMISSDEAIYYGKIARGAAEAAAAPAPGAVSRKRVRQAAGEKSLEELLEEISRSELAASVKASPRPALASAKKLDDVLVEALKSFHLKEYQKALMRIEEAIDIDRKAIEPYYLAAEIYVNQGRFEEAKNMLASVVKINPMFAPAHYLAGCILMEEEALDKAKESLRKAIYIDKDFSLARFYLAQAYKNEGKVGEAIREYRNTIKLLSDSRADAVLPHGGGFNVATLTNACRENIERLKIGS